MGKIRSRASIKETKESHSIKETKESQSYPGDDANFGKPLRKKLCLPCIDILDEEDKVESDSDSGEKEENSWLGDTNNGYPFSKITIEASPEWKKAEGNAKLASEEPLSIVSPNFHQADPTNEQTPLEIVTTKGKEALGGRGKKPSKVMLKEKELKLKEIHLHIERLDLMKEVLDEFGKSYKLK